METKYVVVQHSGYEYGGKEEFQQGLETRRITRISDLKKVLAAGGKVFDSYFEAEEYALEEMYKGVEGLIPNAPGRFSDKTIDDLAIYIPVESPIYSLNI